MVADQQPTVSTEILLVGIAIALSLGLVRAYRPAAELTNVVVELAQGGSANMRSSLSRLLGDPDLEVGYWVADRATYLTMDGAPLDPHPTASARSVTRVEWDGQPVAMVIHDPVLLAEPGLVDAVATAARLAASNDRLRATLRAQSSELEGSRRRLMIAGYDERQRLEGRLRSGVLRQVDALAETVESAMAAAGSAASVGTITAIERAQRQLDGIRDDVRDLAAGLHPGSLAEVGLDGALSALAAGSSVPVHLSLALDDVDAGAAAATWFICSEALANVVKHARATTAFVSVRSEAGALRIEISDDGTGGADITRGFGLRGLADRAEAFGGTFEVDSHEMAGTRIRASIPVGHSPSVPARVGDTVASTSPSTADTPAGTDASVLFPAYGGITNHHMEGDHG